MILDQIMDRAEQILDVEDSALLHAYLNAREISDYVPVRTALSNLEIQEWLRFAKNNLLGKFHYVNELNDFLANQGQELGIDYEPIALDVVDLLDKGSIPYSDVDLAWFNGYVFIFSLWRDSR